MNKITYKLPYMSILTYYLNKKLEIIKVERVILPKERGGVCSGRSGVTCRYDWEEQNSRAFNPGDPRLISGWNEDMTLSKYWCICINA